jgi:hypothetical protein
VPLHVYYRFPRNDLIGGGVHVTLPGDIIVPHQLLLPFTLHEVTRSSCLLPALCHFCCALQSLAAIRMLTLKVTRHFYCAIGSATRTKRCWDTNSPISLPSSNTDFACAAAQPCTPGLACPYTVRWISSARTWSSYCSSKCVGCFNFMVPAQSESLNMFPNECTLSHNTSVEPIRPSTTPQEDCVKERLRTCDTLLGDTATCPEEGRTMQLHGQSIWGLREPLRGGVILADLKNVRLPPARSVSSNNNRSARETSVGVVSLHLASARRPVRLVALAAPCQ